MTDRVSPLVHAMQPTGLDAATHRSLAYIKGKKLFHRHDAVLTSGVSSYEAVDGKYPPMGRIRSI